MKIAPEVVAPMPHADRAAYAASAPPPPLETASRSSPRLDVPLTVTLVAVGVLVLFWKTTWSMIAIWMRSETFVHGFVVLPIFFYLLWRDRRSLQAIETRPCFGALFGITAAGAIWLLGELVGAASVAQFAMVAMIPLMVWTVLGTRVARTLAIPLAFLFFAVPLGEFLLPTLINWTADFTVAALRASGVPVYREGNFFTIPSGNWSVVEACSGLRYLIASFMVGCLYAYLSYRSTARRAAFIAASIIVPIVANWMRAYMIVMLGHLSANKIATGVDHLIYGWVFFGLVMILLFWIGGRWREDLDPVPISTRAGANAAVQPVVVNVSNRRVWIAAIAAVVLAVTWQLLLTRLDESANLAPVRFPAIQGMNGWVVIPASVPEWQPDVSGARAEYRAIFAKDGEKVGVHIAFFRGQTPDSKAITSTNELVRSSNKTWRLANAGAAHVQTGAGSLDVRTAVVVADRTRLALWQWFWIDGRHTSNDYLAKLYQVLSVLAQHGDSVAWVIVYTPTETDEPQVRATLQKFSADMVGTINAALKAAATQ